MKKIVLFIHTIASHNQTHEQLWVNEFTKRLSKSLENFNVTVSSIAQNKEEFLHAIGGEDIGCYLPIVDRLFSHSHSDKSIFSSIKDSIGKNSISKAFTLSLIQEVVPINYAIFQPFYNFYNQGFYTAGQNRFNQIQLPGNNTEQSFQYHINNIAKEINYQIIRLSLSANFNHGVYIGSTTSDLSGPINSLYNFLLNNNLEVFAPINPEGISISYAKKRIMQNLQRSWLSIHPIGNGTLSKSNFLENNLTLCELENETAIEYFNSLNLKRFNESYFKRIIWLPKSTTHTTFEGRMIERIKNSSELNADILHCSFDELKEIIISYYNDFQTKTTSYNYNEKENNEKPTVSGENKKINYSESVFILFEKKYEPDYKILNKYLDDKSIPTISMEDIGHFDNFTESKDSILKQCKGIVMFASSWNNSWFKSNLTDIIKARILHNIKFNYFYLFSREIEQLPQNLENDIILKHISGIINHENLSEIVFN
jgi:hypothetical protein